MSIEETRPVSAVAREWVEQHCEKLDIGVSTIIKNVWYNPDDSSLYVEFHNRKLPRGDIYKYTGVPEDVKVKLVDGTARGESIGGLFDNLIKKNAALYPYEKVIPAE